MPGPVGPNCNRSGVHLLTEPSYEWFGPVVDWGQGHRQTRSRTLRRAGQNLSGQKQSIPIGRGFRDEVNTHHHVEVHGASLLEFHNTEEREPNPTSQISLGESELCRALPQDLRGVQVPQEAHGEVPKGRSIVVVAVWAQGRTHYWIGLLVVLRTPQRPAMRAASRRIPTVTGAAILVGAVHTAERRRRQRHEDQRALGRLSRHPLISPNDARSHDLVGIACIRRGTCRTPGLPPIPTADIDHLRVILVVGLGCLPSCQT